MRPWVGDEFTRRVLDRGYRLTAGIEAETLREAAVAYVKRAGTVPEIAEYVRPWFSG
jgi:hypothetical protein